MSRSITAAFAVADCAAELSSENLIVPMSLRSLPAPSMTKTSTSAVTAVDSTKRMFSCPASFNGAMTNSVSGLKSMIWNPSTSLSGGVDIDVVAGLFVTRVDAPAQLLVHDPAQRKTTCHDYLLFERFRAGMGRGEVADVGFITKPGQLHLIDMSRRYVSVKQRSRSAGVCIPHALVGYTPGVDPVFASLSLDTPKGRLLAAAHQALCETQADPSGEDTEMVVQTFVDLVRRFMLAPTSRAARAPAADLPLALLLRDHAAASLHRADLDADTLARAFGVSRATVYRHFAGEGGVTRYVRNRRLDRCFYELAGASPKRGQIAAVSRRWHFHDATNFNRLFRERFDMPPSACLGSSAVMPKATCDQHAIVRSWLDRL